MLQLSSLRPVAGIPPELVFRSDRANTFGVICITLWWVSPIFISFPFRVVNLTPSFYFKVLLSFRVSTTSLRPAVGLHHLWFRSYFVLLTSFCPVILNFFLSYCVAAYIPLVCLPLIFLFHWNFLLLTLTCLWCYFNWFFPFDLQLVYFARACGVSLIFYIQMRKAWICNSNS